MNTKNFEQVVAPFNPLGFDPETLPVSDRIYFNGSVATDEPGNILGSEISIWRVKVGEPLVGQDGVLYLVNTKSWFGAARWFDDDANCKESWTVMDHCPGDAAALDEAAAMWQALSEWLDRWASLGALAVVKQYHDSPRTL